MQLGQSLWMVLASFLFALMGVFVKLASPFYSTPEIVFYRALTGVLLIGGAYVWHAYRKQHTIRHLFATPVPWLHLRRGASGVAALSLWYVSIAYLPLATAMTLNYTSPIFLAVILAVQLWINSPQQRQYLPRHTLFTLLLGFTGVALLLQPAFTPDLWWVTVLGLCGGLLSALAYMGVGALSQAQEPEWRIVFYFSCFGTLIGALGSCIIGLHSHTLHSALYLLGTGLSATGAQLALTRAYSRGKALVTANLQYSGVIFASGWGYVLWHEQLNPLSWCGIFLIITSGIMISLKRQA
jgi:S-adenosylmethionine uptake transporter